MAGEKQVIYYSTIHLTRREDILVQSIISLYRSKDGFEWIHSDELQSAKVVIVGTAVNSLIKPDSDPFEDIQTEQVVCILGEVFYPKNARAVVHIDLPIKALIFVDQLSDIERSINKPMSVGYIASNVLAKQALQSRVVTSPFLEQNIQASQGITLDKNGMIDFVPRNTKQDVESVVAESDTDDAKTSLELEQFKKPILAGFFLKNETVKQDSFSFTLEADSYRANIQPEKPPMSSVSTELNESVVLSEPLTLKEPVVLSEPVALNESVVLSEPVALNESVVLSEPLTSKEPVVLPEPVALNESVVLSEPLTLKEPVVLSEPVALNESVVLSEPLTLKEPVVLSEPVALNESVVLSEPLTLKEPVVLSESVALKEPAVLPEMAGLKTTSPLKEPPVLTEAIVDDSSWERLFSGKTKESLSGNAAVSSTLTQETSDSVLAESKEVTAVAQEDTINKNATELPATSTTSSASQERRIKLLRWPKSEIIQCHPGNAILASMVINIPMSVNDMAKQSDLPIQICQRFMDAVVQAKVAEYVDELPNTTETDTVKEETTVQVTKKEEVTKRKGILYRIRAALGLLRK